MNIQQITRLIVWAFALPILTCPAWSTAQTVAYTDANLITMGKAGQIEKGTLLVRDGKIVEIGETVEIPGDARVVSMQGHTIMPGIVDPYYIYKTNPQSSNQRTVVFRGRTFRVGGGGGFTVSPFMKVAENFYPYDLEFMPAIRNGITTLQLVSDGQGLSALANVSADPTPEMLLKDTEGFLFAKVTNQTSALDTIRKNLDSGAARPSSGRSMSREEMMNRMRAARRGGGARPPAADRQPPAASTDTKKTEEKKPETDPIKAMWNAVREGKKGLVVNANNAATVAYLTQMLKKFDKVKLYLVVTGPNVFQSLEEIQKNKNVTLILQPSIDTVPYSSQFMNVPKMADDMKIPFALSLSLNKSQLSGGQDDPLFPVTQLMKTGLSRDRGLEAVTITPAKMLGIDKTHGSLEKGKVANFLVFDGDPLTTGSQLKQVFLMGKSIHEN